MSTPGDSPLGRTVAWPARYDPGLLFAIARADGRRELGIDERGWPRIGCDLWTAYELGWLDPRGKPCVGIALFAVPADTPRLVESKSIKLYLNAFAHERMDSGEALAARIAADLSDAAGGAVAVEVLPPTGVLPVREPEGECIDDADVAIDAYGPPDPSLLRAAGPVVEEVLVSHLFRSNCPVTGQPDWASVQLRYRGPRIDREALLRYLVSYRTHSGFHEQCVERIFMDLLRHCKPQKLAVYARFTRRGGLDINPWRSNFTTGQRPSNARLPRQ